jgi:hypothetical protein
VFVTETRGVYCAVRTDSLNKLRLIFVLKGLINDEVDRLLKEAVVTSFDKMFQH